MSLKSLKEHSVLGKTVDYNAKYDSKLLFSIPRFDKREELGITQELPFVGADIWNAYEVSWLNPKGKPVVAIAVISVPCDSPNIFESKSLKLYFNSFNHNRFASWALVEKTICEDLSNAVGALVSVRLTSLDDAALAQIHTLPGLNIDDLDVSIEHYTNHPEYLSTENSEVSESLNSHLLKSNCLITNQPDWASVLIQYKGCQINHKGLLKYLISMRNHNEFHEQCVERIFCDVMDYCKPDELLVYARYTRRGGIDINPVRATKGMTLPANLRLIRQ